MEPTDALIDLGASIKEEFGQKKRVLSFPEYFQLFWDAPHIHARNAARYLVDAFEHYGSYTVKRPWGEETRFGLFDTKFLDGRGRLIGQERAQASVYRILRNFTREGRVNKLILLHGPNGSAKSTFIECIQRALVDYSKTDGGALYTFRWVFPSAKVGKKRFGFDVQGNELPGDVSSFAYLEDDQVDVRLGAEMRDHPLLLLPKERRNAVLDERLKALGLEEKFTPADYLVHGDLSPRNRQVFDALLTSYKGDFDRVLQHVQVERFFISRRYRKGAVTIEPQLHVDAGVRQITADKSLERLPPSLQNVTLFEPLGDLVDANRGVVEYNDLLKKPVDAFKYLLSTCEKGTVTLPNCILYLDLVFLGSSNEVHLAAFKEYPDFQSFKGRIELVRVPYIRSYVVEQQIYDSQVTEHSIRKHIAPHASHIAALWAVLTRLRRPDHEHFPKEVQDVVRRITPLDKAHLYATGRVPSWLAEDRHRDLDRILSDLYEETQTSPAYEGVLGASPREMKTILLNAAQDANFACLSPLAIFAELERLVADPSVYDFLKIKPDSGYHDHAHFIEDVRGEYLDLIDEEFRDAMGLVGESQYLDLFTRYITHVGTALKREKIWNPLTKQYEDPDERFMREMEESFGVKDDPREFRQHVLSSIAAWRLENRSAAVDYRRIFPKLFEAMRDSYYEKQKDQVARFRQHVVMVLDGDGEKLNRPDRERADACIATLEKKYGYCPHCTRDAMRFLHQARYRASR